RAGAPALHQGAQQGGVLEASRLRRRAVDLVEVEVRAEERARLGELRREARERELLLLVHGRVHAPARGVAVAPLAPDGERARLHGALAEPARQELLGAPVAARHVEVADAGGARGVEDLRGARVERLGGALAGQVVRATEVDVAGTADRRQAEAEPGHGKPALPELPGDHVSGAGAAARRVR